jgi:hypothetical protein
VVNIGKGDKRSIKGLNLNQLRKLRALEPLHLRSGLLLPDTQLCRLG